MLDTESSALFTKDWGGDCFKISFYLQTAKKEEGLMSASFGVGFCKHQRGR
jgi:hypothetical protein